MLTVANSSNFPKSSFRSFTSSWAVHCDAKLVNPTMSANNILWKEENMDTLLGIKILHEHISIQNHKYDLKMNTNVQPLYSTYII